MMTSFSSCWRRFQLVSLVVTVAIYPQSIAAQEEGCFDFRDLTCDVPQDEGDTTIDINLACLAMESQIMQSNGALSLARSDRDAQEHQQALSFLKISDDLCYGVHNAYHKCWWCAQTVNEQVSSDFCQFKSCAKPEELSLSEEEITATCEILDTLYDKGWYPATIDLCEQAEQASFQCPVFCDQSYLGADTEPKKKAIVWMSRVSAFLSFVGACYILYDVASDKKNRKTVYHQLLFGMASFDICTAVAWGFATAPIPSEKFWIYGAIGNEATCKTQAFFIQLGFTSVFYNVSLALYYLLVIVYAWRERSLVEVRHYLHGVPLSLGLVLAFSAIPVYDWYEYGCHLLPPPQGSAAAMYMFAIVPLGVSILAIITCMGTVYYKVRAQARTSRKWSFGVGSSNSLETRVFYQSLWYVLSFLVSWPILFAMYIASVDEKKESFPLTITLAFLAPLQGFNNCLVYLRPKYNAWLKKREKKRKQSSSVSNGVSHSMTYSSQGSSRQLWRAAQTETTTTSTSGFLQSFRNSFRMSFLGKSSSNLANTSTTSQVEDNSAENSAGNRLPNRYGGSNSMRNLDTKSDDGEPRRGGSLSNLFGMRRSKSLEQQELRDSMFSQEDEDEDLIDPSVLIAQEDREERDIEHAPELPPECAPSKISDIIEEVSEEGDGSSSLDFVPESPKKAKPQIQASIAEEDDEDSIDL